MLTDIERRQALCELMMRPDPPGLRRGFVQRFEGRPDRHLMLPHLAATFVQWKLVEQADRGDQVVPINPRNLSVRAIT